MSDNTISLKEFTNYIVEQILTTNPCDWHSNFKVEDNWFFLNNNNQVCLNWKNPEYLTNLLLQALCKERGVEYRPWNKCKEGQKSLPFSNHDAYYCLKNALTRKAIKEVKAVLRNKSSEEVNANYRKELVQVKLELKRLSARKEFLESLLI